MYEMPDKYPHFGYMRGRYSTEELKELDDYAYSIGIEIVPCIQTLGHMNKYLRWSEAAKYRETPIILKPGDEAVDELIRDMLVWASKPFRSKRIHVGLDEARQLGLGTSLKRDGYRNQLDIFLEHVNKVAKMCEELGLHPMMWNDLVFCFCSKNHKNTIPIPFSPITSPARSMLLPSLSAQDSTRASLLGAGPSTIWRLFI